MYSDIILEGMWVGCRVQIYFKSKSGFTLIHVTKHQLILKVQLFVFIPDLFDAFSLIATKLKTIINDIPCYSR